MRKLPWFATGVALICLLLTYKVPVVWLLLSGIPVLVGWQMTRPKRREEGWTMAVQHSVPYILWQICRRGTAIACGCVAGLCWCGIYGTLLCAPAMEQAGEGQVAGTVLTQPQRLDSGGYAVTLRLDSGYKLALYTPASWESVQVGDHVEAYGQVAAASFTQGDGGNYTVTRGIFLQGSCKTAPRVEHPAAMPLECWPAWAAQKLRGGIETAFDEVAAPMAVAVTLGDKSGITDQVYQGMTRAGVLHAAVVSGLHISFLVGTCMLVFRGSRRWALILLPVLLFYAFMAGGTPSALRAVWMQGTLLAVPLVGREHDGPSALAFALLMLLVQNPFSVASVGLQLSFASVAGIMLLSSKVYARMTRGTEGKQRSGHGGLLDQVWRMVSASVSASLGALVLTTPLVALYFGQVSLVAPLANLLVLWAMTGLMICALVLGMVALVLPGLAIALGNVAGILGHYAVWVVDGFGSMPYATLDIHNPYHVIWLVGVYVAGGFLLWGGLNIARGTFMGIGLAAAFILPVGLSALTVHQSDLVVAGVDVGQGSSTLLLGSTGTVVVDCGGQRTTSAGDLAADYLASVGRRRVDALVLTHLDADHCNGVLRLLQRTQVGQVLAPITAKEETAGKRLAEMLRQAEVPCKWVEDRVDLPVGETTVSVLPPLGVGAANDQGLFVLASAGTFDTLITGDADQFVENMLLKYVTPLPDIELLIVGHHGSRSSTRMELLTWTMPELAIISAGAGNSYGHPHPETLERLWRAGVKVYRTDQDGTVTVAVKGEKVGIW